MSSYRIPAVKLSMIRDGSVLAARKVITQSAEAATLCRSIIGQNDREELLALLLDAKHKVSAVHSVSVGSLTLSIVHPLKRSRRRFSRTPLHCAQSPIWRPDPQQRRP
jgi:DNA repair protein RadC